MKTYLSLLLLLMALPLIAQEEMTLERAISLALENNFQIKISETNIQVAENNNTWGRAGRYPIVNLSGSFNNTLINDNNPASFLNGTYTSSSLSPAIDAQWLVYNGGRVRIAKEQLGLALEQQRQLQSSSTQNVIRDVIKAYYDILLQKERLLVLEQQLQLSQDRMEYEQVKREFGTSNSFALVQFEQAISTDSTNLISQGHLVETNKRNLYNLLNQAVDQDFVFPERLEVSLEDIDPEKMKDLLLKENYTLQNLEVAQALAQVNTKLEESSRKPRVNIGGNLGFSEIYFKFFEDNPATGEPFEGQFSNRINLGLNATATWNLYDGGVSKSNVANAGLQEQVRRLDYEEAALLLNNQLDILLANYENLKEVLRMNETQIKLAERNLEMAEERLKAAQITSLDYRNLQNQLLNTQFAQVSAIYNLLISKTEIDWLIGAFL